MAAPAAPPRNDQRGVTVRPEQDALVAFQRELDKRRDALVSSAAGMVDPERFRGVVLSAFSRTPGLWECDPVTVARAVVEAAQLGLEPTGLMGGAYLVPYYNGKTRQKECQLIVGYRGMADLARRSGEVEIVQAEVVREADEFDWEKGLDERLVHRPALSGDRGQMTHVYAIARYRSGNRQFDVMDAAEVEVIKGRSKSRDRDGNLTGPWVTDFFEMAKKTVVRRMAKLLPLSVEARRVIENEDAWEGEGRTARPIATVRAPAPRSRIAARVVGDTTPAPPALHVGAAQGAPTPAAEPATPPASSGDVAGDVVHADPETGEVIEPAKAVEVCGSVSPYGDGATCTREATHSDRITCSDGSASWKRPR